ncbi:MAG TPA: DUF1801 domain-containing protein [Verrucomicrobiae bacterium]|nr:DUF1801 domain-containing protein [Verrucomicrobiae bacterium]
MVTPAATVEKYLQGQTEERKAALGAARAVILKNLPEGYEECIQCGAIAYVVPHRLYPPGYHCDPSKPLPYAMLSSHKGHMSLHLMTVYGNPAIEKWFREQWRSSGKKLDMGKACIRFKKVEDLPLDVVGQVVARVPVKSYIGYVERMLGAIRQKRGK